LGRRLDLRILPGDLEGRRVGDEGKEERGIEEAGGFLYPGLEV
jgi:hypothetical protein